MQAAGKESRKVCLILLCISHLVTDLMASDKRLLKNGNGRVYLPFAGERIIISLKSKDISRIAVKRGLDRPWLVV